VHMVQLMPLHSLSLASLKSRLTSSVPAFPGCPGKEAIKQVSLCLMINVTVNIIVILALTHLHCALTGAITIFIDGNNCPTHVLLLSVCTVLFRIANKSHREELDFMLFVLEVSRSYDIITT